MAGDTANPRIWVGADVLTAPLGSTIPTDTTTAWAAAWDYLGLLSQDGATESRDQDSTDHYAWGNIFVRTTNARHKRTFTVAALEENAVVLGLIDPDGTSETAGDVTTRYVRAPGTNIKAFGWELVDGDITKRIVIPRGEVTEVGDVPLNDSAMTAYEFTITCYATTVGDEENVLYVVITDDPQAEEAS